MTIGSGASGGIFSPSLFLGATLGGAWGHVVAAFDPYGRLASPIQALAHVIVWHGWWP